MPRRKRRSCYCTFFFLILVGLAAVLAYIAYPVVFPPEVMPKDTPWPESLTLIERDEWTDSSDTPDPEDMSPMGEVTRITVHHDGMPPLPMTTETQIKKRITSIRNAHSQKYADIGYHYIVDPLGRIWQARSMKYQGAHAKGENTGNIGVMFLGNTYDDKPTEAGLSGLFRFLVYLRQRYEVDKAQIYTHRELGKTGCPGKMLQDEMDKARDGTALDLPTADGIDWQKMLERAIDLARKVKRLVDFK